MCKTRKYSKKIFLALILVVICGLGLFSRTGNVQAYSYECTDGIDNDADGKKDYSATSGAGDPQCSNAADDHEGLNPSGFFKAHSTWREPIPDNPVVMYAYGAANSPLTWYYTPTTAGGYGRNNVIVNATASPNNYIIKRADVGDAEVDFKYDGWGTTGQTNQISLWNNLILSSNWNHIPIPNDTVPSWRDDCCGRTSLCRDSHAAVVSSDLEDAWETYEIKRCAGYAYSGEPITGNATCASVPCAYSANGTWSIALVKKWDLTTNGVRDKYVKGSDASVHGAYTPMLQEVLTLEELINKSINHAIGIVLPCNKVANKDNDRYPNESDNGGGGIADCTGGLVYGNRLQLNPSLDISTRFTPNEYDLAVINALKKYGAIFVDSGGESGLRYENRDNEYECSDGIDNDLDGLIDYPKDTYCSGPMGQESAAPKNKFSHFLTLGDCSNRTGLVCNLKYSDFRVIGPIMPSDKCVGGLSQTGNPNPTDGQYACNVIKQDQCADGIDNDSDGKIDYPADTGCSSAYSDDSESGSTSNLADIDGNNIVNIKDIQICVKAITNPTSITSDQLTKCKAAALPSDVANIKDIQAIVRAIIAP